MLVAETTGVSVTIGVTAGVGGAEVVTDGAGVGGELDGRTGGVGVAVWHVHVGVGVGVGVWQLHLVGGGVGVWQWPHVGVAVGAAVGDVLVTRTLALV